MVVKKRQTRYDFNGFYVPSVPKAPRSARGRGVHCRKKVKVNGNEICAIELLASLAGKLLQESESSSASSNASIEVNNGPAFGEVVIKPERDEGKPLKTESYDQEICEERIAKPTFVPTKVKEFAKAESDFVPERSSVISNSDSSEKVETDVKHVLHDNKTVCDNTPCKLEGRSPDSGELVGLCSSDSKNTMECHGELPALLNLENNASDLTHNVRVSRHKNGVKSVVRDDDEKFTMYNKLVNKKKGCRPTPRIGDRRIRKLLQSKYWRVAPKFKDCELSKCDGAMKLPYRKRKVCYNRQICQHDALHKRRKFPNHSLIVTSDGGFSSESVSNSPEKSFTVDRLNDLSTMLYGVNGVSSSAAGHESSMPSEDSHVKFSIKSFRIPELFIEVPENSTVGSLKRTVMEAVNAILEGGLRVGLLLHGKMVRDDNRTLSQTGITSHDNLDALGFTLEPSSTHARPLLYSKEPPAPLPLMPQLVSRSPAIPVIDSEISDALSEQSPPTATCNSTEVKHESGSPDTDTLADIILPDSRALVSVPPTSVNALAVVPLNQKPKRSELVQRRTRRPFSVSEVEALVKAVEELGTGRWRDVKLRSFENADHRTYVDLKDKWKTLVHTAQIAPQQRRGEPVPQELLVRVLAAHAYWSQHQAKQHSKNILKTTDTQITRTDCVIHSI